ncbi:MAG: SRPBCC family protein [Nocardioides alkalitolerans]
MVAFSNSRSIHVAAPPEVVGALVDDLRAWQRWSPWEGVDPQLERTYTGPERGVGSRYAWRGNKKAGTGSMEVTTSTPEEVTLALAFVAPIKAENTVTLGFVPEADGTTVTWTMSGERNRLMAAAGALFFDKALGKDVDRGLASLKREAEADAA